MPLPRERTIASRISKTVEKFRRFFPAGVCMELFKRSIMGTLHISLQSLTLFMTKIRKVCVELFRYLENAGWFM